MRIERATFAANLLTAANAANAWRPFSRFTGASVPAFFAGWPTSELPLEALATLAAGNALAARRGGLRGPWGLASAGLALGTAATLANLERIARGAGEIYEQALRDGLGADYRDRIEQLIFPGPDGATAHTPGVVRTMRIRRRFAHDHDISYGPKGRANLLDIWRRADLPSDAVAPVLIQMPGGAWMIGNKQAQAYPLMSHLAEQGWICVAINYRHSPRNSWPAHIVDVKSAIAWVRRHIAGYGGDPDFIALTGGSAGGHLSSLAALTANDPQWQPGFTDVDTSVAAALPFYGAYDWVDDEGIGNPGMRRLIERRVIKARYRDVSERFADASPISRIHPDAPPFFVSHGVNDALIPVEQARAFVGRLRAVSTSPVVYAELPKAEHAFDIWGTPRATFAADAAARFLGVVWGDYRRRIVAAG